MPQQHDRSTGGMPCCCCGIQQHCVCTNVLSAVNGMQWEHAIVAGESDNDGHRSMCMEWEQVIAQGNQTVMDKTACARRRLTVPLTGAGEASLSKLMKDDSAYTFSELPRMNPLYKVCSGCVAHVCLATTRCTSVPILPAHLSCASG